MKSHIKPETLITPEQQEKYGKDAPLLATFERHLKKQFNTGLSYGNKIMCSAILDKIKRYDAIENKTEESTNNLIEDIRNICETTSKNSIEDLQKVYETLTNKRSQLEDIVNTVLDEESANVKNEGEITT